MVKEPCESLKTCTNGQVVECLKSCHIYAACFNNQYMLYQCRRGERYLSGRGCVSSRQNPCDYSTSGLRRWQARNMAKRRRRGLWGQPEIWRESINRSWGSCEEDFNFWIEVNAEALEGSVKGVDRPVFRLVLVWDKLRTARKLDWLWLSGWASTGSMDDADLARQPLRIFKKSQRVCIFLFLKAKTFLRLIFKNSQI